MIGNNPASSNISTTTNTVAPKILRLTTHEDKFKSIGISDYSMLPSNITMKSIAQHLPLKKFKKPSWSKPSKPPCVILSCGSFSPPTYLHLRIMEEAKDHLSKEFEVIGGILSPVNDHYAEIHKPSLKAAKGIQRAKMTELATKSSDWIGVSDFEVILPEWSRTAVVLETYGKAINHYYKTMEAKDDNEDNEKHVHVKYLCGSDLLSSMRDPGLWSVDHQEMILGKHGVIVIERARYKLDEEFFNSLEMFKKYRNNIHTFHPCVENTISSTKVREELKQHRSIKYLVPDAVIDYIAEQKLYQ